LVWDFDSDCVVERREKGGRVWPGIGEGVSEVSMWILRALLAGVRWVGLGLMYLFARVLCVVRKDYVVADCSFSCAMGLWFFQL